MIRVGVAGWSYADWEGRVYPRKKPRGFHGLRYLARYFDCIEVNSPFYAPPRMEWCDRWLELVEDRPSFRFAVKLQNVFTHAPLPKSESDRRLLAGVYLAGIEPLVRSGKLAAVLVQFPRSFRWTTDARRRLEFIESAFAHLPLTLEVRHESWFRPEPLDFIASLGYSLCAIDLPHANDHPPREVPRIGPVGYLRLHGRNAETWFDPEAGRDNKYDYLYSEHELSEVAKTAKRLAEGRDETYVFTNNHFGGQAVANALDLMTALGVSNPAAPVELIETYPHLRKHTRPDGQTTLF